MKGGSMEYRRYVGNATLIATIGFLAAIVAGAL
jgi:hypothetical protein